MIVTILICLGVVSGFVAGWTLKHLSSANRLSSIQQRWRDRYKKISKQRSSYLLQASTLDTHVLKLQNQLTCTRKKTSQQLSGYHFDHKKALIEISRMREEIDCKDARISQSKAKEEIMQTQLDANRSMIDDLKTRYCAMSTEVDRLRITNQIQKLTLSRVNVRRNVIVSQDNSNVIQLDRVRPNDLILIKGIGSGIEKTLNQAGIFSYRQMAELPEDKLKQLQSRLKLGGKARWESWIKQAKLLVAENTTVVVEQQKS